MAVFIRPALKKGYAVAGRECGAFGSGGALAQVPGVADCPGTSCTEADRQRQSCWFESCPNARISVCSVAAMPVSSSAECLCAYSPEKYAAGGAQRHSWRVNMPTRSDAEIQQKKLIEKYGKTAPNLSSWLENELPEGFTVFNVEPDSLNARRKLRTTNMVEFQNKELKKRTRCIRVFPNKESLLRIATALLIELDEKWLANGKVYLKG